MNHSFSVAPIGEESTAANPIDAQQHLFVKQLAVLILEMLLALPLGFSLARLNIGGIVWIFGGIAAGAIVLQVCRIFFNIIPNQTGLREKLVWRLWG